MNYLSECAGTITASYAGNRGQTGGNNGGVARGHLIPVCDSISRTLNAGGVKRQDLDTQTFVVDCATALTTKPHGDGEGDEQKLVTVIRPSFPCGCDEGMRTVGMSRPVRCTDCGGTGWRHQLPRPTEELREPCDIVACFAPVQITSCHNRSKASPDVAGALPADSHPPVLCFRGAGQDLAEEIAYLRMHGFSEADARRLAHTPDGPRYAALGNSMAVPVIRWLCERLDIVNAIP